MSHLDEAVQEFLRSRRIAVAGVSRDSRQTANAIYKKLRASGYPVVAMNPKAQMVEGDPCYPNLASIPDRPDAVMIVTRPDAAAEIVRECAALGIRRVWMHRSLGQGSVSPEARRLCAENGIAVIAGACPMMYVAPIDLAHRCFHAVLGWFGGLPRGEAVAGWPV